MKIIDCPMCGGLGYYIEPMLDDGSGPKEYCGYCRGTGQMEKTKFYYQCLGVLSGQARRKKRKIILRKNI